MTSKSTATRFLLLALILLTGADKPPAENSAFRFESVDDRSLKLLDGERPVLVYNHGDVSNEKAPKARPRGAYVHPIYGMDGEVLTDDFPADHVNHRGLYWAWPHVKVGETEQDSWNVRDIRTRFGKWTAKETHACRAVLGVENGWFVGDKQVARENVRLEAHSAIGDSRAIDVTLTWTALHEPITLRGAEGKGYGGVSIRFGPRKTTVITVPNGRAKKDLVVAKLPWADLSGDLGGKPDALTGAALFAHPTNRDFPPEWMTRGYGMLAAGWPGVKPQTIGKDESVTLQYRLWIHRGNPEAADIQKAFETYRSTKLPGDAK
ncbi:MAG: PmoA family protein [Planctomycetota bacterium]|nr:PmoA family protein [Planctomycetota bacterium]